jgi:hypothetical protein
VREFHIARRAMKGDHYGISKTTKREVEASKTTRRVEMNI